MSPPLLSSLLSSLLPLPLLLLPGAPALAAPPRLLSVEGEVRVGGRLAARPSSLPPGATLELAVSARVQLLLPATAAGGGMALGVIGPARLRVGGQAADVELTRGDRLRASGWGRVQHRIWELELRGSSAVLEGSQLYLTRGSGVIRLRQPAAPASRPEAGEPSPAEVRLAAGQSVRLGGGELSVERAAPSPELAARLEGFVAPRWRPALPRVTVAEVHRAEGLTGEQRRAERETASCGCTESKGSSSAPQLGTGPGATPLERQAATLRVRVVGIPRAK